MSSLGPNVDGNGCHVFGHSIGGYRVGISVFDRNWNCLCIREAEDFLDYAIPMVWYPLGNVEGDAEIAETDRVSQVEIIGGTRHNSIKSSLGSRLSVVPMLTFKDEKLRGIENMNQTDVRRL